MTQQQLKEIREFYTNTIMQGVIRPIEINKIYCYIHPEESNPMGVAYKIKQRAISVFVQNKQWQVLEMLEDLFTDKTDTSEPLDNPSIRIDNPSHEEDFEVSQENEDNQSHSEVIIVPTIMEKIAEIEKELETCTDSNESRSLKMRLNHLKKKLNA